MDVRFVDVPAGVTQEEGDGGTPLMSSISVHKDFHLKLYCSTLRTICTVRRSRAHKIALLVCETA